MFNSIGSLFGQAGKPLMAFFKRQMGLSALLFYSLQILFIKNKKGNGYLYRIFLAQTYFTGVQSIGLISLIAFTFGVTTVFLILELIHPFLELLNTEIAAALPRISNLVLIRVMGPLLTAVIVIARSGTAIITEVGNMVVKHEVEALETMGIDTLKFIVLPRILGVTTSLLLLNFYFNIVAISSGLLFAKLFQPEIDLFAIAYQIFQFSVVIDLIEVGMKALFFGLGISVISLMAAFVEVKNESKFVPYAAGKGVVGSISYVFIINAILTGLFVIAHPPVIF